MKESLSRDVKRSSSLQKSSTSRRGKVKAAKNLKENEV